MFDTRVVPPKQFLNSQFFFSEYFYGVLRDTFSDTKHAVGTVGKWTVVGDWTGSRSWIGRNRLRICSAYSIRLARLPLLMEHIIEFVCHMNHIIWFISHIPVIWYLTYAALINVISTNLMSSRPSTIKLVRNNPLNINQMLYFLILNRSRKNLISRQKF